MQKQSAKGSEAERMFAVALPAGTVAILLNTALLATADAAGLVTARGGLLKLVASWGVDCFQLAGREDAAHWLTSLVGGYGFRTMFHLLVGLAMAATFTRLLGQAASKHPIGVGLGAALVVWLLNAAYVLPATGQGFAGADTLSALGVAYYALAHTVFFVVLSFAVRYRLQRIGLLY